MTAFLIADIKVTDDKWVPAYAASIVRLAAILRETKSGSGDPDGL